MTYTLAGSKQTAIALETSQMGAGPGDCYETALEASLGVGLGRASFVHVPSPAGLHAPARNLGWFPLNEGGQTGLSP